jgi:alkylhydroperoxidase family enzyme
MTWIKTIPASEDEAVRNAIDAQRELYPIEYATPVHPTPDGDTAGIVDSHSLIPEALYHAFSTFGALMSSDLPLTRRQHEMITTVVSVTNRCHY